MKKTRKMLCLLLALVLCISVVPGQAFAAGDAGIEPHLSSYTHDLVGLTLGSGSSTSYYAGSCAAGSSITVTITTDKTMSGNSCYLEISGPGVPQTFSLSGSYYSYTYNVNTTGAYTVTIRNSGANNFRFLSPSNIYVFKM